MTLGVVFLVAVDPIVPLPRSSGGQEQQEKVHTGEDPKGFTQSAVDWFQIPGYPMVSVNLMVGGVLWSFPLFGLHPEDFESYSYQAFMTVEPAYPFCIFGLGSNSYFTRKGSWVGNFWDAKPCHI